MKKSYFILAAAALAFASCANDDYVGNPDNLDKVEAGAIAFGGMHKATTRATEYTGAPAATLLDNNYVVEGIKYAPGQIEVFDHYNVNYKTLTAGSTESNSNDWEYVGQDQNIKGTSAKLSAATAQTIKYWDYAASQYDFVAVSLGKGQAHDAVYDEGTVLAVGTSLSGYYTESAGVYSACDPAGSADGTTKYYAQTSAGSDPTYATLSKIDYTKLGTTDATYTLTGTYDELASAYIADLVSAYKADDQFGASNVITPKFRRAGAKVRMAFYDQVPGYAVSNIKFYTEAWTGTATVTAGRAKGAFFTANPFFVPTTGDGKLKVSYPTVGYSNKGEQGYNQAVVEYAADDATLGTVMDFAAVGTTTDGKEDAEKCTTWIGRSSATASYAGDYVTVIPQGKGENLQIRIEYDLYPTDGGAEVIHVRDARAVVPAQYADWKSNYAYTYIFKISDATNGWTGVGADGTTVVEGLTPITFDAIVVDTEDAKIQETITSVSSPSITTYALGTAGVDPTGHVEYNHGQNIYVSVADVTLADADVKLYTAALANSPVQGISEASVANALANGTPSAAVYEAATGIYDASKTYYSDDQGAAADVTSYVDGVTDITSEGLYVLATPAGNSKTVTDINGGTLTVTVASEAITVTDKILAADTVDGVEIAGNFAVFNPTSAGTYVFEYTDGSSKKHYKVIIVY